MAATVRPVQRKEPNFKEKSYLPEVLKGLALTNKRFWKNLVTRKQIVTLQYPEVKRRYPPRYRGHHRLMHRDDGSVRCVACMLCSTACPANCIHIEAGDYGDNRVEKFPTRFEIDLLVCIYCGLCEEACPCDAIRMDSGVHPLPSYSRDKQRVGKVNLLDLGSLSIAKQGGKFS
jgi:NADH-quinone oxidoreductase subunit I